MYLALLLTLVAGHGRIFDRGSERTAGRSSRGSIASSVVSWDIPDYPATADVACTTPGTNLLSTVEPGLTGATFALVGDGVAAPTLTTGYGVDPSGQNQAARVQFAAVGAAQESSMYMTLAHQCDGVSCVYSVFAKANPTPWIVPIASAQNGNDGASPQYFTTTTTWVRYSKVFNNTGVWSFYWLGYAAPSQPGLAGDVQFWGPKVELGSTLTPYSCAQNRLSLLTSDWGITVRDGAGLVTMWDGTLVLLGGWHNGNLAEWGNRPTTNQIYHSNDNGATWAVTLAHDADPPQTGAGQRWRPRHPLHAVTMTYEGREYIYVIGGDHLDTGYYGAGTYPSDVWRSADEGATWEVLTTTAPWGSRMLHQVWKMGSVLYVAGGQTDINDKATAKNDVYKSVDGGRNWSSLGNAPWTARGSAQVVNFRGKAWLMGGQQYDAGDHVYFDDVWSFDGTTWTQVLAHAPWTARGYANSVVWAGKMWILRGTAPAMLSDLWGTSDGVTWTQNAWPASGVVEHAGCVTVSRDGTKMIVGCGTVAGPAVWTISHGDPLL